ncbi:PAS domain-containing protein [Halorussus caseinilyticus]|uniref:PAS domain-containing protein n=1 Tax=Halorussus caseinilyticus TaxID=3034025 RepID=A0ABD5WGF5_9EURY
MEPTDDDAARLGSDTSTEDAVDVETEVLLQNILDGLEAATLVVDADGDVTHLNRQALALFDTTQEDAVGRTPDELRGDGGQSPRLVEEALETGEEIQQRQETLEVGGETIVISRSIVPFVTDEGEVTGGLEIDRDVTARIEEERRKEKLNDYQQRVLTDLQTKLDALADGDLTIDPSVPEPDADFAEMQETHAEFTAMNRSLERAVENIQTVVEDLTAQRTNSRRRASNSAGRAKR